MLPFRKVHFIGIGGYGMSAIARVLLNMGYEVTGSDKTEKDLTRNLAAEGARVFIGHRSEQVEGAELVVYSTDIPQQNEELQAAMDKKIPLMHRAEVLAHILNARSGVAVAGAHGKTTTSSMLALLFEHCGADPTYVIGGEIIGVGSNARAGNGPYVVAEADESDGSFLQYHPEVAVVTNIEPDHLENYGGDYGRLKEAYVRFLQQVKPQGFCVVNADDPTLMALSSQLSVPLSTYSVNNGSAQAAVDLRADSIVLGDRQSRFAVLYGKRSMGEVRLRVPGLHNVSNALAALAVGLRVGFDFAAMAEALYQFRGAKRRFQVVGEEAGILVVDDYAHHPTEIRATLEAARDTGRRVLAVFQPQRYTRTFYLLDEFSHSFGAADQVWLTEIYSPSGDRQMDVSGAKLAEAVRSNGHPDVRFCADTETLLEQLPKEMQEGDLVLTMGAGDVWKVAEGLVEWLQQEKRRSVEK